MTDQAPASSERIERLVAGFIEAVGGTNGDRGRFDRAVREIATLGQREILATSQMSRRLLDEPGRVISDAFDGKSEVGRNLAELRRAIQELDPARLNLSRPRRRKLLGVIPM